MLDEGEGYEAYLRKNGFLVDSLIEELNEIKSNYWDNKFNSKVLHISILTTLNYNFKSITCFESRSNINLNDIQCEKIFVVCRFKT